MPVRQLRSRIYYITRDYLAGEGDVRADVRAALCAGVGMVQYRANGLCTRELVEQATALVRMTRAARVPLIINGRVDVALAVGADGVHLGARDLPIAQARRLLGPGAIVGATVMWPEDARLAEREGASYVSVGNIFPSSEFPHLLVQGIEGLIRVHEATSLPVCAMGGLTEENLSEVGSLGAELFAVSSAVHESSDPYTAACALVRLAATLPKPRRPAP